MKKLINYLALILICFGVVLAGLLLLIAGCQVQQEKQETKIRISTIPDTNVLSYNEFRIIEIEGCEYILLAERTNSQSLTHKGNCKNPIHKYVNKEEK